MNRRYRVLPYKQGSKGAKALATALGGKVLKLVDSMFIPKPSDVIINWGNSTEADRATLNNNGGILEQATNKKLFFEKLAGTGLTPRFWTSPGDIPDDAFPIVCRTKLTGHSGAGIVIADTRSDLVSAPLYVEYKKKKHEYRIHVGRKVMYQGLTVPDSWIETVIIGVQQKKRRTGHENPDWKVRNHANGFIYAREGVKPPDSVIKAAKDTLEKLGIDFGAVDVIYNTHEEKAYVLEINTAPGLEGSTVNDYVKFFKEM